MITVRELMTPGAEIIDVNDSAATAALKMRELNVGSLPICGDDGRLAGVLTDRDIVVRCVAEGRNPNRAPAGELAQGPPVVIGVDDSAADALHTMAIHQVRRLPVIDNQVVVGMLAQADVARALPHAAAGGALEDISRDR
jgi:CBS domain-containing protein